MRSDRPRGPQPGGGGGPLTLFAALRRLRPARPVGWFVSTQTFAGDPEFATCGESIHPTGSQQRKREKKHSDAGGSGGERAGLATARGNCDPREIHFPKGRSFRLQTDVSPAQPPHTTPAAAAPNGRVRPRGWARPRAQGAQCRPAPKSSPKSSPKTSPKVRLKCPTHTQGAQCGRKFQINLGFRAGFRIFAPANQKIAE